MRASRRRSAPWRLVRRRRVVVPARERLRHIGCSAVLRRDDQRRVAATLAGAARSGRVAIGGLHCVTATNETVAAQNLN